MTADILRLGRRIYNAKNWREAHRLAVFLGRGLLHRGDMRSLLAWFRQTEVRRAVLEGNPFPMEQATRAFFYAGSTFAERTALIKGHFALLEELLLPAWAARIGGLDARYPVWQSREDAGWRTLLTFEAGQRKEGLCSLVMQFGGVPLYQMMFWLAADRAGESSLWIGAMQGPNAANAQELIREATKRAHRYRTKNLILYMTMALARALGMQRIYAVSNAGYYANNHIRRDRKLKTDFGAFWEEAGGHATSDPRFYELPLVEPRKEPEEIPTRKRAVYRKRFAFQDDVDAQIAECMGRILK